MQQQNQSDVVRIKSQIELETATACYAMYGPILETVNHRFFTERMKRIGELHDDLMKRIGERRATLFLVKTIDRCWTERARPRPG